MALLPLPKLPKLPNAGLFSTGSFDLGSDEPLVKFDNFGNTSPAPTYDTRTGAPIVNDRGLSFDPYRDNTPPGLPPLPKLPGAKTEPTIIRQATPEEAKR